MKQQILNFDPHIQGMVRKVAKAVVSSAVVILMGLALSGCVKQKNCDCGIEGTFVYEPVTKEGRFYINDATSYSIILGSIPKAVRSETPIEVSVCLEYYYPDHTADMPSIMKFTCVEKL